jgi:hypothetical protein
MKFDLLKSKKLHSQIGLTGSINNVMYAAISSENSVARFPAQTGYSFGLGAFGPNFPAVRHKLGELCTAINFIGVLTAGEENLPVSSTGMNTVFYTPFNVSIGFDFEEVYSFQSEKTFTWGEFYNALFGVARQKSQFMGMLGISVIFRFEDFFGSLIKTAPLKGSLPEGKITDADQFDQWFIIDKNPVYPGYRAISVGVGLEISTHKFSQEALNRIFYFHPGNIGASDRMLHNHCFILPPAEIPQNIASYNSAIAGLLSNSQILDVKHILDNSTLKSGFVAVNYIQEIGDLQ